MAYKIKTISSASEVENGNVAKIDIYNWGGEYRPYAQGKLCYIKGKGFVAELMCNEANPMATYKEQNQNVCEDSCLEFFVNFAPEKENSGYINFECNANGSLLCCYGTSVRDRKTIVEMGLEHPKAAPFINDGEWGYCVGIPLSLIKAIYGEVSYKKGSKIKGGFFKCGDKTEIPHFGSYTKIETDRPSFHQPQFFADMVIE